MPARFPPRPAVAAVAAQAGRAAIRCGDAVFFEPLFVPLAVGQDSARRIPKQAPHLAAACDNQTAAAVDAIDLVDDGGADDDHQAPARARSIARR